MSNKRPYRNPNQRSRDVEYLSRQADRGIVRKTVLVPANRLAELHELLRVWRAEADIKN